MLKTTTSSALLRNIQFAILATVAASLVACGGGSGSSTSLISSSFGNNSNTGTTIALGAGVTPLVLAAANSVDEGTVTGKGSVYINGTAYDDSQARIVELSEAGTFKDFDGAIGLGHHVEALHNGMMGAEGKVKLETLVVDRAVRGPVTAISTTGFTVMGQTITVNADAVAGTVTAFGGNAASLADVAVGDWVSVFGVRNATSKALAATRVDEQTSPMADKAQVSGVISDVTATSFKIAGLSVNFTAANLYPANTTLVAGNKVKVWTSKTATSSVITADKVVLCGAAVPTTTAAAPKANVRGLVSNFDATAKTFTVAGIKVNYSALTTAPTGLDNGAIANVVGTVNADGSIAATNVSTASAKNLPTVLVGDVADFVSTSNFTVRGVSVDASTASILPSNCVLANAVAVQVLGSVDTASGNVTAKTVNCPGVQPANSTRIVSLSGVVSKVDATGKTFTVTDATRGALTVAWDAKTRFMQGVTAANLSSQTAALQMDVVSVTDATGKVTSLTARLIGTDLRTSKKHH